MKLWIARDNYGFLGLYKECPIWGKINELDEDWKGEFMAFLPKSLFPEITFATAFKYPETCYDIFIDKDYPCTIITSK